MIYDLNMELIDESLITWDPHMPQLTYDGVVYKYDADFSNYLGPITEANAEEDMFFWNDLLMRTYSVSMEFVQVNMTITFEVDEGIQIKAILHMLLPNSLKYTSRPGQILIRNICADLKTRNRIPCYSASYWFKTM